MKKIIVLLFLVVLLSGCVGSTTTQRHIAPTSPAATPTRTRTPTRTPVPITFAGCVNNTLRVRAKPSTDSEIIGRLTPQYVKGQMEEGENYNFTLPACVSVVGRNQDTSWVMVSYEGQTGWVFADHINIDGDVNQLAVETGNSFWQLATIPPVATKASKLQVGYILFAMTPPTQATALPLLHGIRIGAI